MKTKSGVLIIDSNGEIFGKHDDSLLKALPWYKRAWAFLNRKYKRKFIRIKPLDILDISFKHENQ